MELVRCPACGAGNHPARTTCGRCRAPLQASTGKAPDAPSSAEQRTAVLQELPPTVAVARPADAEARAEPARERPRPGAGDTQPLEPVDPARIPPAAGTGPDREATGGPGRPSTGRPAGAAPATGATRRRADDDGPSRRGLVVVLAGAAIGAIVGLAASLSLGPFASTPSPPAFDENVYRRAVVSIDVSDIRATSSLPPSGDNSYEPQLMVDGDTSTAWNSLGDSRPDGVGERITIQLAQPAWVTAVRLANGDQRSDQRFLANSSLARAIATFDDGTQVVLVFLDQPGEQEVALPAPELTSTITLEVVEAHPGDTSQDLAVSEVAVIGHLALGADREWQLERSGG